MGALVQTGANMTTQERFYAAVAETPTDLKGYEHAVYDVGCLGRNDIPALLFHWEMRGILTPELLRLILEDAWCWPEAPEFAVHTHFWTIWFRRAGFLCDKWHSKPAAPLKIYRGVCPAHRRRIRRMSWTEDLEPRSGSHTGGNTTSPASMKRRSHPKACSRAGMPVEVIRGSAASPRL